MTKAAPNAAMRRSHSHELDARQIDWTGNEHMTNEDEAECRPARRQLATEIVEMKGGHLGHFPVCRRVERVNPSSGGVRGTSSPGELLIQWLALSYTTAGVPAIRSIGMRATLRCRSPDSGRPSRRQTASRHRKQSVFDAG
jgi:hypothetical protein